MSQSDKIRFHQLTSENEHQRELLKRTVAAYDHHAQFTDNPRTGALLHDAMQANRKHLEDTK